MGDKIIITDDDDKPKKPDVVVVAPQAESLAKLVAKRLPVKAP